MLCACNSEVKVSDAEGLVKNISTDDFMGAVVDAYLYGYPLLLMNYTKQLGTNTITPHPTLPRAPINQLGHYRKFPDHTTTAVVKPNVDTYYSIAWFDLNEGPQLLHMPATERYYLLCFYDAFTNVFANPGTRTSGTDELDLLILGPSHTDVDTTGYIVLRSPTAMAWLIGRIETYDDEDGSTVVRQIQDAISLIPHASVGDSSYIAPQGTLSDGEILPPVEQMESLSTEQFINQLAQLLKQQKPANYDRNLIDRMASIGIEPGETFELPTDNFILTQKLKAIPSVVHKHMRKRKANPDPALMKNNWTMITSKLGDYEDDYLIRSYVSFVGLGANLAEDAIYPFTTTDADGETLDGSQSYTIHMDASELPPVQGFWSLTAYNPDDFLIDHGYDRYAINSNDKLHYNADGSLDLIIQSAPPSDQSDTNWLPVRDDQEFSLTMRLYWPEQAILDGEWIPPSVTRKNK
jgi:hypothetical protein